MKLAAYTLCSILALAGTAAAQPIPVSVEVNTTAERKPISPLIYGINAYIYDTEWGDGPWKVGLDNHAAGLNVAARRLGGNTMTSYNWENGFSNSGNDDNHSNNVFQSYITGAGDAPYAPGEAITTFHDQSLALGAYSLLQLPAAGYVAADRNGMVQPQEAAPSARWKQVVFDKPGSPASLSETPDLNDGTVYVDEEIQFLLTRYGQGSGNTGIKGYELDNEPGLWHHFPESSGNEGTHSRLHADILTAGELLQKNIALAKTVRRIDPTATIYGPAMWGYPEFYSLWSIYDEANNVMRQPLDWGTYNREPYLTRNTGDAYRYNRMTWVNAYLAEMRNASETAGGRLLDAFSVHYYSAAAGSDAARVQAPRSLWDPTFVEDSWITKEGNGFTDGRPLLLIPKLQTSITDFYPGTKLAITEYSFGGRHHVSGGIAQADALGIFGRTGLDLATYFFTVDDYIAAAFKLYRNYDGANSTFGDLSVGCTVSDMENSSAHASLDSLGRLHLIVINKNFTRPLQASLAITSPGMWGHAEHYMFGQNGSELRREDDIRIEGGSVAISLPPLSVHHLVLSPMSASGVESSTDNGGLRISADPNPASAGTRISIATEQAGQVTVRLYDMLGRELRTLSDGFRAAGTERLWLDGADLPAGTYMVVVTSAGKRYSVPVTLVK